jgi:hypothetical protein
MGDWTAQLVQTLIVGMCGSGKTGFALRLLLNAQGVACRFIYDDMGRIAPRLRIRPCYTARELDAALATRWVIFSPWRMFSDPKEAFNFFCTWVCDVSKRGPGRKLVLVDEVWQWVTPHYIPLPFATLTQASREDHVELITCTQTPQKLNDSVAGLSTELVCFKLQTGSKALEYVTNLDADEDAVANLPMGHFIAYNRLSGGKLAGKLW